MPPVVIGIKKTAWNNANDTQQQILRWGLEKVGLDSPAEYRQGNTRWYIFYDWRITLVDVARIGTLVKGLSAFPNYQFPTKDVLDENGDVVRTVVDKVATKQDIVNYVQANWVDPVDVPLTEMVDKTVPVREQVEALDENGDSFDPPVFYWRDHPTDTRVIQVEESLGDAPQLVLAAQGAPNSIQCASVLPANWTPVEVAS